MSDHLHKNLLYLRKLRGWTQTEMGNKIGGNLKSYQQWEYGNVSPDTDVLLTIARKFKVSIEDLLTKELSETKIPVEKKEKPSELLFTRFAEAEADTKKIVCALLKFEM